MVIAANNKANYFYIELDLPNLYGLKSREIEHKIETNIDVILASMGTESNVYKFKSSERFIYVFSTNKRKRKGQLNRLIEKNLLDKNLIEAYDTVSLLKNEFHATIEDLKSKKSLKLTNEPIMFENYTGRDLKIFDDKENWFPWQKKIYDELFHKTGEIKIPDERKIIALYDAKGNSGKSSFFKYLLYRHLDDIGRVTYGTGGQLRSCIVNTGPKKIYIIDLTRTKGTFDKEEDLLSIFEDLKNGLLLKSFHGSGEMLLMDIPHVIVSANYIFNTEGLSQDRWEIYSVENKELKDITKKVLEGKFKNELKEYKNPKKLEKVLGG